MKEFYSTLSIYSCIRNHLLSACAILSAALCIGTRWMGDATATGASRKPKSNRKPYNNANNMHIGLYRSLIVCAGGTCTLCTVFACFHVYIFWNASGVLSERSRMFARGQFSKIFSLEAIARKGLTELKGHFSKPCTTQGVKLLSLLLLLLLVFITQ